MTVFFNVNFRVFASAVVSLCLFPSYKAAVGRDMIPFKYIITETTQGTSFDPLDADQTGNLPIMRMLYSTPLEISPEDKLESVVLKEFKYNKKLQRIELSVRNGLFYSDASPITAEDVAFAIVRMAHARPKFPVLREIEGIEDWANSKEPLKSYPKGINVNNDIITIQLKEDVAHPLFRFSLEIFSIIPKKCVDLTSGGLLCKTPPFSGNYELGTRNDQAISFVRRKVPFSGNKPESIDFLYKTPQEVSSPSFQLGPNEVFAGNESKYTAEQLKVLKKKFSVRPLPKTRFSALLLNPDRKPFNDKICRQVFASEFRKELQKEPSYQDNVEGSISPKVIAGYSSLSQLNSKIVDATEREFGRCKESIKNSDLVWTVSKGIVSDEVSKAFKRTLEKFQQKNVEPRFFERRVEEKKFFADGKSDAVFQSSGLWPLDAFGDLQMLFTPNLHQELRHISSGHKLQETVAELRKTEDSVKTKKLAQDLNTQIFEDSLYVVYAHSKRIFVGSTSSSLDRIPMAISGPSPWQVFYQGK